MNRAPSSARPLAPPGHREGQRCSTGPPGRPNLIRCGPGRRRTPARVTRSRRSAAGQCEGCTFYNGQIGELSYLHSRDVTYATFCPGPYEESVRYRDFMGWEMPWYSAHASLGALLTGRQIGLFHLVCYLRDGDRGRAPHRPVAATRSRTLRRPGHRRPLSRSALQVRACPPAPAFRRERLW
jgi:hypothetical protein